MSNSDTSEPMPRIILCAVDRASACGGPYSWARYLPVAMRDAGFDVGVLIACPGGRQSSPLAIALEQQGIAADVLDTDTQPYIDDQTRWFVARADKHRPTVFIANLVLPALYACRWLRSRGIRTVGVVHSDPLHDPFYAEMLRRFGRSGEQFGVDHLVCVSEAIAESARIDFQVSVPLTVIPCGAPSCEAQATAPSKELRLLYAGRLVDESKKIREMTESFLAAAEELGIRGSICGDGPERDWLEARLCNEERIRYLGNIAPEKMCDVLHTHHVIVLLSDYEGLPMALVEGMASGLVPVVLDRPGGVREVVDHGVNGLLVDDRGAGFLAAVRLLQDPEIWQRLSQEAVATVQERYAHHVVFSRWSCLLRELSKDSRFMPVYRERVRLQSCADWFGNYQRLRPPAWRTAKDAAALRILRLRSRLKLGTKCRTFMSSFYRR